MKKRKILLLIPFAGLVLSGCTFQDGISWLDKNIYSPVKDWIVNLFNGGKKEEPEPEPKPEPQPQPGEVEVVGSLENPLTISSFQTYVNGIIDAPEDGETNKDFDHIFYVKGTVKSNKAADNERKISFINLQDGNDKLTIYYSKVDSSLDSKYLAESSMVGCEITVRGYAARYNKEGDDPAIYEIISSKEDDALVLKVDEPEQTPEPEKLQKTLAEIVAAGPNKSQAYISSAKIKSWAKNDGTADTAPSKWGNLILTDDTNDVFVYGSTAIATDLTWNANAAEYTFSNSGKFLENDLTKTLAPGDVVDFVGIYFQYGSTLEMNIVITGKQAVPVTSVTLDETEHQLAMEVGKADVQLHATVLPENATEQGLNWASSDPEVATVDENGLVHAVAQGTADITVSSKENAEKADVCHVSVSPAEAVLDHIVITGEAKDEYVDGDAFTIEGLGVELYYSDNSHEPAASGVTWSFAIDQQAVTNAAADQNGKTLVITATYGEKSATLSVENITVAEAKGTETNPYSVADARAAIDANKGITGVYATGIVSKIAYKYSSTNKNMSFFFKDSASDTDDLEAYKLASETDPNVEVGDVVTVYGNLTKHNTTYEFTEGCTLTAHEKGQIDSVSLSGTASQTTYTVGDNYNHDGLKAMISVNGFTSDVSAAATWSYKIDGESVTAAALAHNGKTLEITATYNNMTTDAASVQLTVEDAPSVDVIYNKVTANQADWSGTYLLVNDNASVAWNGADASDSGKTVTISNGSITNPSSSVATLVVESMTGGYSVKIVGGTNNGKYIDGKNSDANGTYFSSSAVALSFSYETDWVKITAPSYGQVMRYNNASSGGNWFRFYKASTYTGQKAVQLYKLAA